MPFICMLFKACNQPSTSAVEAHNMTVMTLEDHSSKSWSHHQCHTSTIRRKCPPPPAAPPSLPSPYLLCLSCGQPGSSYTCEASPYTIRHINIGALLCLQR